ncbi:MAG: MFS transporter [Fimbriimonadaceae bacterium]|nr:MFS transporter [Fimbriimonadaceae bacterium]
MWIGQIISLFGDSMYMLVFFYVLDRMTKDPGFVGLVLSLQAVPFFALANWSGHVADKFDRRLVLALSELFSAVLMIGIALYAWLVPEFSPWVLATTAILLAVLSTFSMPARGAAVPRLVPPDELMNAQALANSTGSIISMVGLAVSAIALGPLARATGGSFFPIAAAINAVTYITAGLIFLGLPKIVPEPSEDVEMNDRKAGWRAVKADGFMRVAIFGFAGMSLIFSGFYPVYLVTNREWFRGDFTDLAWIEFSFFVAMIVGSGIVAGTKVKKVGLAFTLGLASVGVCVIGMAWAQNYGLYLLLNALCGIGVPYCSIPVQTYVGTNFPDAIRGRVGSFLAAAQMGVQPIGLLTVALVVASLGLSNTYILMGSASILIVAALLFFRSYREAAIESAPQAA